MSASALINNLINSLGNNQDDDGDDVMVDQEQDSMPMNNDGDGDEAKIQQEEEYKFDIKNIECLPVEVELLPQFQKWMNLDHAKDSKTKTLRKKIHLKLLDDHPFVKKAESGTFDFPDHSFSLERYQLNIRAFAKWCKIQQNREWKVKAGGNTVTDDGLYTVSVILRRILPRGFHSIFVMIKSFDAENESKSSSDRIEMESNSNSDSFDDILFFRGIPKFTGLVASDEDDVSNSHQNSSSFFYRNYTMSDCQSFVNTAKSNGENAKLSVVSIPNASGKHVVYALSGSKNTCDLWPINEHCSTDLDIRFPSGWIGRLWSNWLLRLQRVDRDLFDQFVHEMAIKNEFIIMGEINEPWMEHIVPINSIFIETYCILDNGSKDGLPIHCKRTFEFFKRFKMSPESYPSKSFEQQKKEIDCLLAKNQGVFTQEVVMKQEEFVNACRVQHVSYSVHSRKELDAVIEDIRIETASEGSVLYLLNQNDAVIGLSKVKASSYVVRRRIRERIRNRLFNKFHRGQITGYQTSKTKQDGRQNTITSLNEVESECKSYLRSGMGKLGHVPNHQVMKSKWAEFAAGFVEWWIDRKLGIGNKSVQEMDLILQQMDQRFASVLQEYADSKYGKKSPV